MNTIFLRAKHQSVYFGLSLILSTWVCLLGNCLPALASGTGLKATGKVMVTPSANGVPVKPSLEHLDPSVSPTVPVTDNTRLVLRLQERRVYLYRGDQVEISYPVAVGRQGWETPTGTFQVMDMMPDPYWHHPWTGEVIPPGPDNPLGVRWIAFWTDGTNYIGFHGTPHEDLIGEAVSHGCVRMRNEDVMALFEKVQVGVPVIVEP